MASNKAAALDKYYEKYQNDPDFIAEGIAVAVVEEAAGIMRDKSLTRSELAEAIGVPKAQVSRMFKLPPNLTLRSIARLAVALGVKPHLYLNDGCLDRS